MPLRTPLIKAESTRGYGAKVVLHGANFDEAYAEAVRIQERENRVFVHPFAEVDRLVRAAGFEPRFQHAGWMWRTVVYERAMTSSPGGAIEATPAG